MNILEVLFIPISIYSVTSVVCRILVRTIKKAIKKNETCFNAFIFKVNAKQHFESFCSYQLKRNFSNSSSDVNHVMLNFAITRIYFSHVHKKLSLTDLRGHQEV